MTMTMSILLPASIPAGEFKAKCLKIMDDVAKHGRTIVITKHGKPVAHLSPAVVRLRTLFGFMTGEGEMLGDIVAPLNTPWNADE
jgi:prevent-host-death family protein